MIQLTNQTLKQINAVCGKNMNNIIMNNSQLINSVLFVKLISQERNVKQTSFKENEKMG